MLFALVVMLPTIGLFIDGLFIEGLAALIIFVPVLMPLIPVFGFDPIQLAMIFIVTILTILIGTVTPPVGSPPRAGMNRGADSNPSVTGAAVRFL